MSLPGSGERMFQAPGAAAATARGRSMPGGREEQHGASPHQDGAEMLLGTIGCSLHAPDLKAYSSGQGPSK